MSSSPLRYSLFAFALATLVSNAAQANTFPIFSKDGKQATIFLQGSPSDPDAQRLFDLLTVPPQDEQGKMTKKVKFTNSDSIDALSVVCAFSKLIPGNGSCILVLKQAAGLTIDSGARRFSYELAGAEAEKFAALFQPTASNPAYLSADHHLELDVLRDVAEEPGLLGVRTVFGYH